MSEHEAELAWTRRSKEAEHVHLIAEAKCRSCVERVAERDRLIQELHDQRTRELDLREGIGALVESLRTWDTDDADAAAIASGIADELEALTTEEVTPNRPTSTP